MTDTGTLTEGESMMEWLDRRIEHATSPGAFRSYHKKFIEMWKENFGHTNDIPEDYKKKVTSQYFDLLNKPSRD